MQDKSINIATYLILATGIASVAFLLASQPGTGMSDAELAAKAKAVEAQCAPLKNSDRSGYLACVTDAYKPAPSGTAGEKSHTP